MRYVVNEVGEGATDAVDVDSAWDAAKAFLERQVAALGAMFPHGGMTIAVRDERGRTSTYRAFRRKAT
jgi:hypothetical protein